METSIIRHKDTEYISIDIHPISQNGKAFYIGKMAASDLLKIYTVRPARYDIKKNSSLASSFPTEHEYYKHLISQNEDTMSDKDFQRQYDIPRVNSIAKFLNNEEYPFFPNTIIANCDLVNDVESLIINEESTLNDFYDLENKPAHLSFFQKSENGFKLIVPKIEASILIIDGQHRLEGLVRAEQDVKDNYELLMAFIIGFDRSVVAKQFYTINYEQKPVNKSLLYHLTGEFSTDINELTFMHNVVKLLNELERSPFNKRIKMLGVTPGDATPDEKKRFSISQAFMIDALIKTISSNSMSSTFQPIFLHYYKTEDLQIEIIKFLIEFFDTVRELNPTWETPEESLLSKGMGVGALIKVLQFIFPIIFIDDWNKDWSKIKGANKEFFINKLSGFEIVDFSKNGPFGGVGSAGSINKIKEEIILNLDLLKDLGDSYSDKEISFKENYLQNFKDLSLKYR